MSNKGKGGRPKGSAGRHSHGLISVDVGDQSSGASSSGAVYGKHNSLSMRQEEIEEIKARRAAEKAQS